MDDMWGLLLSLIPSLIQMLFGGGNDETQQQQTTGTQTGTTSTTALPSGYQSPTLGLNDLLMQAALGKNLSIFGGAGLPKGQTIAPDFLNDFLSLIGSSYTDLQKKQTNPVPSVNVPSVNENDPATATTLANCIVACDKKYGISSGFSACHNYCQSKFRGFKG